MIRDHDATHYLTIAEVSDQLHLSRSKVYDLMAREGLPVVRFGRAVRVSVVALHEWIDQREQQTRAGVALPTQKRRVGDRHHRRLSRATGSLRENSPRGQRKTQGVL